MFVPLLLSAAVAAAVPTVTERGSPISVLKHAPDTAGAAVLHPFVSFSIEFAFFPDYAGTLKKPGEQKTYFNIGEGNLSKPNKFSNQLLDNLGDLQGAKPFIRVGGNTQ
jgi:hypothetical protein